MHGAQEPGGVGDKLILSLNRARMTVPGTKQPLDSAASYFSSFLGV